MSCDRVQDGGAGHTQQQVQGVHEGRRETQDGSQVHPPEKLYISNRVAPDAELAGYPAAGYPANNLAGYPVKTKFNSIIKNKYYFV